MAVNYSILTDVEFDTSQVRKKLQQAVKGIDDIEIKVSGDKEVRALGNAMDDTQLSFQAANEIFRRTIDVISTMAERVYKLDSSLVEFQKVSDLSGDSLDRYVNKLTQMGGQVARTGKPKCLAPNVGMINQHLYPL